MTKDENKVSLENCDFSKKKIRITSPHSLLACEIIGVDEDDLIYTTKDEYILKNQDCLNLNIELQDERYNHFNARRLNLIELAKNKRKELIANKSNNYNEKTKLLSPKNTSLNNSRKKKILGNSTFYKGKYNLKKSNSVGVMGVSHGDGWGSSTAIRKEKEKLKKLRERQEMNIILQIDYECAKEENRRKNMEKMRLKEEKEERMRIEKNNKMIEKLRNEEIKERNRKKKEEQFSQKLQEKRRNEEMKEKLKKEEEEKRHEEEEKERVRQMQENEKKEKDFRDKVDKINKQQHYQLIIKQKELYDRDEKRKINMEKKKEENARKMNEKRKMMEGKIAKALLKNESLMKEKISLYLEKQKKMEEIQELKEKEKLEELIRQNEENRRRNDKIKAILEKNEELKKQKIIKYNKKIEIFNQRQEKRHQEELKTIDIENKRKELKDKKMKETRDKHERQLSEYKNKLLIKLEITDERIKRQREELMIINQKKYNKLNMMREDRKDKVVRNDKIQKFERKLKMAKIKARMDRIEEMKRERFLLEEERRKIEEEMNNKKNIMMGRLNKLIKSDNYFTRDEIINYVLHDIKPNKTSHNFYKHSKSTKNIKENDNKEDINNSNDQNSKEEKNNDDIKVDNKKDENVNDDRKKKEENIINNSATKEKNNESVNLNEINEGIINNLNVAEKI